ncbi:MAG: hypothetical protein ACXVBE_13705 [Bdellovibrionota bacterium]
MQKIMSLLGLLLFLGSTNGFAAMEDCQGKTCNAEKPECKKGAEIVNVATASDCCPRYACRAHPKPRNCDGAVCTGVMPVCVQGQEPMNKATAGACCPNWVCVDKKL